MKEKEEKILKSTKITQNPKEAKVCNKTKDPLTIETCTEVSAKPLNVR